MKDINSALKNYDRASLGIRKTSTEKSNLANIDKEKTQHKSSSKPDSRNEIWDAFVRKT